MNLIVILLDSLNFHCLEPYGATHVHTPNLKRLAERSVVFDNHFAGSMPCMPARRELFTGRQEFLWRGWGHIEPWDRHLADDAADAGATTQMITDHYHYWESAAHGYFEPFRGMEFIRGHEHDMWRTDAPPEGELPPWVRRVNEFRGLWKSRRQPHGTVYYANNRQWKNEADFPCAQVMARSAQWLTDNREHEKFMLWIEGFDPHEPHFLPEPYRTIYAKPPPASAFNCWPPYQDVKDAERFIAAASDEELAWIRAQYYGKVTMVDHHLGRVLDRLDALDRWKDTAVILTTDHGHDLCYGRNSGLPPWAKAFPHPESHARIPLMIWHPDHPGNGRRVDALSSAVDVNATAREILGSPSPNGPHGRSLMPLVAGRSQTHRDCVLYGTFARGAALSTREWTLAQGVKSDRLFWHSTTSTRVSPDMACGKFVPGVEIPQWRTPVKTAPLPDYLWRRQPFSLTPRNEVSEHPDIAREMREKLKAAIRDVPGPAEALETHGLA